MAAQPDTQGDRIAACRVISNASGTKKDRRGQRRGTAKGSISALVRGGGKWERRIARRAWYRQDIRAQAKAARGDPQWTTCGRGRWMPKERKRSTIRRVTQVVVSK